MALDTNQDLEEIKVTARPLPTDEYVDSRDFRIQSISLIASNGDTRDISSMVMEIQVRQDMHLGFMSGELMLTDGIDLFSMSGMHGNEYILLHLIEPQQTISINKAFRVYKVGNRVPIQTNSQRFTVYFMSDEMFDATTQKVSKAYKGSKVSDVVQDILTTKLKIDPSRIIIDPTGEPVDIMIPNKNVLESLKWLSSRAFTPESTCWFFFENLDGFNFRSLNSIYKQGTKIKVPFVLENKTGMKQLDMDKYAVDSFEAKKDFDALSTVRAGGYAMSLLGLDPFHQSFTTTAYSMEESPSLYPHKPMTNTDELFGKGDAYYMTYIDTAETSTEKASNTKEWVKRDMALANLNGVSYELVVPGNMRLQAGTLMSLRFPYAVTPPDGADMWDKKKSGKYLIVAVNHKFDLVNHRFDSIVLVTRDSIPESHVYDNKLNEKIRNINANANRES
jgi:hypothetical protein